MRRLLTTLLIMASVGAAIAAEPIEGNWKTKSGETAAIAKCGGAYCVTLKTGKYSGKRIGEMSGAGADYKGEITDPENDKTYSGYATVSGASMKLKGCVMGVLCKSQTWTKL
jgi:uncharacterized protein (DUF2147 family)